MKSIKNEITVNLGTICIDSSVKFKFLKEGDFFGCKFSAVHKDNDFRGRTHSKSLITSSFRGSARAKITDSQFRIFLGI